MSASSPEMDVAGLASQFDATIISDHDVTVPQPIQSNEPSSAGLRNDITVGSAPIDLFADPSQLRWVGMEFVYFLDIPWVHDLQDRLLGSAYKTDSLPWRPDMSIRALTFGLLESVMKVSASADCLLVRSGMNQLVISGDNLSRLVVPWARALCSTQDTQSIDALTHRQWGEHVKSTLITVVSTLDNAVYAANSSLLDAGPDVDLVCALATFLVSLSRCARAIWGEDDAFAFLDARTRLYGEVTYILRGKLAETWQERSGFEMERLLGGGIPFAAYATGCQPTVNRVETVDSRTYHPQHVSPSCGCDFVKAEGDRVRGFLLSGEVPVVVFDGSALRVRAASDSPYVAISHVWADGLGSTAEEGLPRCQVTRLSVLARQLVPNGAFWQDGLCVPSERAPRRRAIGLMASTYAQADKVLVIDGGIRTQCTLSTTKEECLLRIATSGWMQRIWTLQEGMLARELSFEVADGMIDCTHFDGAPCDTASKLIPLLQYRRCTDGAVRAFQRRSPDPPRCTVNDLIALLRYRTTSHPEDEPIAISGLLGVDAGELVCLEGREERMKALLLRARVLPRQLAVFGWICPRLSLPNFGWAPASLSAVLWPGDADDPLVATCTEEGLFGTYTVVRFSAVTLGEDCGVIATITEEQQDGSRDAAHNHGTGRPQAQCTRAGCASRVFNLVLSPYFFRIRSRTMHTGGTLTFDGFLMKAASLPDSMREEGVGVIRVVSSNAGELRGSPKPDAAPLHCEFVAPGSARWGVPDAVETTRSRGHWHFVNATVTRGRDVKLT